MEEFALLAGSIGLFMVFVISMYLSRNMYWYGKRKFIIDVEPEVAFV